MADPRTTQTRTAQDAAVGRIAQAQGAFATEHSGRFFSKRIGEDADAYRVVNYDSPLGPGYDLVFRAIGRADGKLYELTQSVGPDPTRGKTPVVVTVPAPRTFDADGSFLDAAGEVVEWRDIGWTLVPDETPGPPR